MHSISDHEQLLAELARATAGLLFMSESDHPFEIVRWPARPELTPADVLRLAGHDPTTPVETLRVEDFFAAAVAEYDGQSATVVAQARRYQALVRLLRANLTDLRVYRLGRINMPVYVIGRSAEGHWLGLSTRVVET